ncbi:MAG: VOC family protein [Nannocystaceae bacterium]
MQFTRAAVLVSLGLVTACAGAKQADTTPPQPVQPAPAPAAEPAPAPAPVKPIPDGFFALTPNLVVPDVDAAVDFYAKALGAQKRYAMPGPDGKTMHAEIQIGDSIIMIGQEGPEMKSAKTLGGTPASLMVYSDDADALYATAVAAGATAEMPVGHMFWGDRYGSFIDPFGLRWSVATHIEDLTDEQMMERQAIVAKVKNPKKAEKKWKKIAGTPATTAKPEHYHTVTPAYTCDNAAAAIEYYKVAFGAEEVSRMPGPKDTIMHAEVRFGDAVLMLSDEFPEMGGKSAKTLGGSPVSLMYYSEDVDAAFAKAAVEGTTTMFPPRDMFWGDRYGAFIDPSGYMWGVATHKEDVPPEQLGERMKAQMAEDAPKS